MAEYRPLKPDRSEKNVGDAIFRQFGHFRRAMRCFFTTLILAMRFFAAVVILTETAENRPLETNAATKNVADAMFFSPL